MGESSCIVEFSDGNRMNTQSLGMKGANLCEMSRMVPVPDGFIISNQGCMKYFSANCSSVSGIPYHVMEQCIAAIHKLEKRTCMKFGITDKDSSACPLLLSVRPSAPTILGGLMESVLNLGLNDSNMELLAKNMPGGNRRFALDTYKRFLIMYATSVLKVEKRACEFILQMGKDREGVTLESELSDEGLEWVIEELKRIAPVPVNPFDQLWGALHGIYESFQSRECKRFMHDYDMDEIYGIPVVIQQMVYGNLNDSSGTGVCFSRLLSVGGNLYGNFLPVGEGDDISFNDYRKASCLTTIGRKLYTQLEEEVIKLEKAYKHNFQFVEFTIQDGSLFLLETNVVKNNPRFNGRHFTLPIATEKDLSPSETFFLADEASVAENPLHTRI